MTAFSLNAEEADLFLTSSLFAPAIVMLLMAALGLSQGSGRICTILGALSAPLCIAVLQIRSVTSIFSEGMCLVAGFLGGVVYGALLIGWVRENLTSDYALLLMTASGASFVMVVGDVFLSVFDAPQWTWAATLFPVLAAVLYPKLRGLADEKTFVRPVSSEGMRKGLFLASLFLSGGIAKALLNWDFAFPVWYARLGCVALLSIACVVLVGTTYRKAQLDSIYACFIGFACIAVLLSIVFPLEGCLLPALSRGCSWFLLIFSIVISVYCGAIQAEQRNRVALLYLGCIFITEPVVRLLAPALTSQGVSLSTLAVITLALSLVCSIISGLPAGRVWQANGEIVEDAVGITEAASKFDLTDRETEVLALLARRYTVKEVAERLVISENTVKFHQKNIYRKLGVSSKQELSDLFE